MGVSVSLVDVLDLILCPWIRAGYLERESWRSLGGTEIEVTQSILLMGWWDRRPGPDEEVSRSGDREPGGGSGSSPGVEEEEERGPLCRSQTLVKTIVTHLLPCNVQ